MADIQRAGIGCGFSYMLVNMLSLVFQFTFTVSRLIDKIRSKNILKASCLSQNIVAVENE